MISQKIVPHLWFDKEAKEAAQFYTSVFPESNITNIRMIHDTPSGDSDIVSFTVGGYEFMAINGGPYFQFNPSISFFIHFDASNDKDAKGKLDNIWESLLQGGTPLMPLQTYPFSEHYGWIKDKYGVSWQLMLVQEQRPFIVPSLLFVQDVCGKAEEATDFYISVFKEAERKSLARYPAGMEPDEEGTVMYTDFNLLNQRFVAMDSAHEHEFQFNEAISLLVRCENQEEIDYYWNKLSHDPKAEQCGWLKDKHGISWQISPIAMEEMMKEASDSQLNRLTEAFLKMKKFDIEKLKKAYSGE